MAFEVEDLRKRYGDFEKKFKLPNFKDMNEAFEIDKMDRDSECFLRAIRKLVMEKIVNSMGFVDMLLNPVNAPRMYYSYLKSMSAEDKGKIEEMYGKLADLSMASLALEIDYDENREAELIRDSFKMWNEMRPKFRDIIEHIIKPQSLNRKEKSYFG